MENEPIAINRVRIKNNDWNESGLLLIDWVTSRTPRTSPTTQSRFGLSGWAAWQLIMSMEWGAPLAVRVFGAAFGACFAAAILLRWFQKHDGKIYAYYLMHDFAHSASDWGAYPADLETRLHTFRVKIAQAMASDVEEVLVVGHSSGAHLAISALAWAWQE